MIERCEAVIDRLLREGDEPTAEETIHIRDCAECLRLLENAQALSAMIEAGLNEERHATNSLLASAEAHAATAIRRRSAAFIVLQALVAAITLAGASLWFVVGGFYMGRSHIVDSRTEFLLSGLPVFFVVSIAHGVVLGLSLARLRHRHVRPEPVRPRSIVAPLALAGVFGVEYQLAQFLASEATDAFGWAIGAFIVTAAVAAYLAGAAGLPYKRLRHGRQLSGVCLGIAEETGLPVWVVRLVFVLLAFGKMFGVALYLILDLLMEIHPDDRRLLLRFRIRRWWRSRRPGSTATAE